MQYQFKTINPSFASPPPRSYANPHAQPQPYQPGVHQSTYQFRMEKPVSSTSVKSTTTGVQSFPTLQLNGETNISEMKKRLDSLLKQTDNLAAHRQINFDSAATKQLETNKYESNRALTSQKRNYPSYSNLVVGQKDTQNVNVNQFQTSSITVPQNNYKNAPNSTIQYLSNKQEIKKVPETQYNKVYSDKQTVEIKNSNFAHQNTIKPFSEKLRKQKQENPQKNNGVYYGYDLKSIQNNKYIEESKKVQNIVKQQNVNKYSPAASHNYSNSNLSYDGAKKVKEQIVTNYEKPINKITIETKHQNVAQTKVNKQLNIYELQMKIKSLEEQNNKLKSEKQAISDSREFYRTQVSDERKNLTKTKEEYEAKIAQIYKKHEQVVKNKDEQTQKLKLSHETEVKSIHQSYDKQLAELNKQILDKQIKLLALVKDVGNSSNTAKDISTEKQNELARKTQQLTQKLNENQFNYQQLKNELNAKNEHINLLNQTFTQLKSQIQELKQFKAEVETEKYSNFDQILMSQLKTINDLKAKIEELIEKNNQIQERQIESERRNDSLINEINIIKLKHKSEINNIELENGITLTTKENTIGTLNKKILTMEDKYKLLLNEIKTKDEFFKQHLVGRTDNLNIKQYIEGVLSKYQQSFSVTRQEQLAAELEKALKKLQLYEKYA